MVETSNRPLNSFRCLYSHRQADRTGPRPVGAQRLRHVRVDAAQHRRGRDASNYGDHGVHVEVQLHFVDFVCFLPGSGLCLYGCAHGHGDVHGHVHVHDDVHDHGDVLGHGDVHDHGDVQGHGDVDGEDPVYTG